MKNWVFSGAIFSSALISAGLLDYFSLFGVRPDLLLICAIAAAVYLPKRSGLFFCFLSGLAKDVFSVNQFPANTILFLLWGGVVIRLDKEFNLEDDYIFIGLVAGASLLTNLASRIFFWYAGRPVPLGIFLRITVIDCLYTTLIALLVLKSVPYWKKLSRKNNADQIS